MKVLILITKSNWGGAQRYVYDMALNLAKNDYDVEVMAGGNGALIDKLVRANIKAQGDLPIGRDVNIRGDIKAFFKLISILKKQRPDILHINSSKIGALGALAGRLTRIPKIVFTAHGFAFNENRSYISKILIKLIYWITIFLSHDTIAVSESLKNQLSNWPLIQDKISVIHNGITTEPIFSKLNARLELMKSNTVVAEIIKSSKNITIIGSVGELHHIKGYEYAIRAVSELTQQLQSQNPTHKVLYLIIGTGEEKEALEKMIKDLGMESTIFLLGYVEQAYHYFKAFDVFLLPSLSEGFPYIGLEAGLASLPVVATAVGGIPEIIDDMQSGILIQPKKSGEIKHALTFYLKHKKTTVEHGVMLHEKVLREFSMEKMLEKTIAIYSNQ